MPDKKIKTWNPSLADKPEQKSGWLWIALILGFLLTMETINFFNGV